MSHERADYMSDSGLDLSLGLLVIPFPGLFLVLLVTEMVAQIADAAELSHDSIILVD